MHPDLSESPVEQVPTLALLGQPNCGKTTLFNALTGRHSRTANYPGATVEFSIGTLRETLGWRAEVIDLPGLASLVPRSPDEEVAVRSLYGEAQHNRPALVIAVVDCSQLSRHLYLVRQLKSTGMPMVVAITMSDLLLRRGYQLDPAKLESALGCPVVLVDGRIGTGTPELVTRARATLAAAPSAPPRRILDSDATDVKKAYREVEKIERACVGLAVRSAAGAASTHETDPATRRIDAVLLHPALGLVAFILIMGALFTGVFWIARPAMDAISACFDWTANHVTALAPDSFLARLVGDGICRGAGAVLTFLPQIVILFLGLGLMEDSGYLARAAVLVDRPLALIGLNGRAFVPLLSGFACAIPGMMAARTIPNRRERLLTIFIMPLMSCSARLPVYALLLAFLTPPDKPWVGGLALTAIYLTSVASGTIVAALLSRFLKAQGPSSFMLELPAYRRPQASVILRSTFHRSRSY
ncbi:MAG: ferrous iron transport protein B, partial [Candidatus Wallbacteria bacterium]|nr:ferrous iron transport protein B [Candidatus Wallbacteria bacterium]